MPIQSKIAILLAGCLCLAWPLEAANGVQASVRASALGGVLLASDGEAAAVFSNPAGLADVERPGLFTSYSKPLVGLPGLTLWTGDLAAVWPFSFGSLALGYSMFQTDGMLSEQTASVGYGFIPWNGLRAGAAVKYLRHDYLIGNDPVAAADPVFRNGTSRGALAADLGLRYLWGEQVVLAAAARNVNQPDWGLATLDRVRLETQAGAEIIIPGWEMSVYGDVAWRPAPAGEAAEPVTPALGVEKRFPREGFALRAGLNPYEVTAGFGWRWDAWLFEYAGSLKFNLLEDNYGTHRLGVSFRLGLPAESRASLAAVSAPTVPAPPKPAVVSPARVQPSSPAVPAVKKTAQPAKKKSRVQKSKGKKTRKINKNKKSRPAKKKSASP